MLTDATEVQRLVEAATAKGHGTEFVGGFLRCRCGWSTNELFFSAAEMEAAAQRHLQGVLDIEDFRTERECPRCHYTIYPGFYHQEQKQPEGSNVVVCSLERTAAMLRGPMVDVISAYLDEQGR